MKMSKEVDVVYPVYPTTDGNPELRYSLRSLEKNLPHGKVFIYTSSYIDWLSDEVEQIVALDDKSAYENVNKKLLMACLNGKISDTFLYMNDDIFVMKKMSKIEYYAMGDLVERFQSYIKVGIYGEDLLKTKDKLLANGLGTIDFETHSPIVFEKDKLKPILEENMCRGHRHTLYGNITGQKPKYIDHDFKVYNDNEYFDHTMPFVSTTQSNWRSESGVKRWIAQSFKAKSRYER